jgi:hypothetical protein
MADTKISALTASTTPLAGTEVLPIVQGGVTKQVSVADLTAGRAISATELTLSTGNLVIGTSGKGIDFSATPGTGTSELLADYEEGTWTPVANGITYAAGTAGKYTKVGNLVTCTFTVVFPATADASNAQIQALPFNSACNTAAIFGNYSSGFNGPLNSGNAFIGLFNTTGTAFMQNVTLSGQTLIGSITYQV